MLVTIGKIEIITHTKMRAPIPPPKTELISGTMARTGRAWAATRYGYIDRSIHRAWAITTASAMPSTMLIDSPTTAANVVQAMPVMYCWRTTGSRKPWSNTVAERGEQEARLVEEAPHPVAVHEYSHSRMNRARNASGRRSS